MEDFLQFFLGFLPESLGCTDCWTGWQGSSVSGGQIRGPGWSPPPMGFYIGILIKSSPPKGGVHKLMIFIRENMFYTVFLDVSKMFIVFRFLLGEQEGLWYRDSHYRSQLIGGVHKLMIFIREKLEAFL